MAVVLPWLSVVGQSRHYNANTRIVNHYITVSVQGGPELSLLRNKAYNPSTDCGANAGLGVGYELRKKNFVFGVGAAGALDYTQQKISDFLEFDPNSFEDFEHDPRLFGYNYSHYRESQRTISVGADLHFGYYFLPNFYGMVGVQGLFPLDYQYRTATDLMTNGTYPYYSEPLADDILYRYYPKGEFVTNYKYQAGKSVLLAPYLELGTVFHVAPRVDIRLAGYVEYITPITGKRKQKMLTDYSMVSFNDFPNADLGVFLPPMREQFYSQIRINSLADLESSSALDRIAFGAKVTFLFNVTPKAQCLTCQDESGIYYRQPRKIRRINSTRIEKRWW